MKTSLMIMLLYLSVSPSGCGDKNIQPVFPNNLRDTQRAKLSKDWDTGKTLFKDNCAKCHGVFNKGTDSITNFSLQQIHSYQEGFLARDPLNHAVMAQMTQEDFNKIVVFLTYLKRNKLMTNQ